MPRTKQFDEKEVLNKAMELFWKKGFHATSIQDLVDELGINRASLYSTFGDKRTLFEKSLKLYRKNNANWLPDFLDRHPKVRVGLKALFQLVIDEAQTDPDAKGCFVVNTTTEFGPEEKKLFRQLSRNKADFEKTIKAYLKKGVKQGEISKKKDLEALTALIFTLNSGLRVVAKVDPDPVQLKQSVDSALSFIFD